MVRIFERYLSDIGRERLLTAEEERELARRTQAGDADARCRLVTANLRFVVSVARNYRGCGVPLADLVNEGNMGLVRAADRFDPSRGVRFISYAHFWVRRAMMQSITRESGRRSPNDPAPIRVSLDDPGPGGTRTLAELLPDKRTPRPGSGLAQERLREAVEASLADLPPRECDVVRRYFGLAGERTLNLGEIASDLGVSRERVRQLKERGISRLRASAVRHGLDGFIETAEPRSSSRAEPSYRRVTRVFSGD